MKDVLPEGTITIKRDNYANEEAFKQSVSEIMCALIKNNYAVCFRYDDCDRYVIEYVYDYHFEDLGSSRFMLVSEDEMEYILQQRKDEEGQE